MKKSKIIIIIFIAILSVLSIFNPGFIKAYGFTSHVIGSNLVSTMGLILAIFLLNLYSLQIISKKKLYKNKRCIFPFIIVFIITAILFFTAQSHGKYQSNISKNDLTWLSLIIFFALLIMHLFKNKIKLLDFGINIKQISKLVLIFTIIFIIRKIVFSKVTYNPNYAVEYWKCSLPNLTSVIFFTLIIMYLFKVRVKYFNWNINIKQGVIVLFLFILIKLIPALIVVDGRYIVLNYNYFNYLFSFKFLSIALSNLIWPAFFEEILYRGVLVSFLKGCNLQEYKINIIQSLVFGIAHFSVYYFSYGWIAIFMVSGQALVGFVLCKLYFKTKSLTPCIILHALLDT